MFELDPKRYRAVWALIGILLGAGWAVYGMTGGGRTFLTVMVVLSMVLGAGGAVLLRSRRT
ncbi:hypothetical protein KRMM14A1259_57650 [Krasilnikovia sp. MM14-A1259]